MPVEITEYVKIKDAEGIERVGKLVAQNLVAVVEGETVYYGQGIAVDKVRSKITCDNEKCENSEVGEDFVTRPMSFEFDDNGDKSAEFIKKISDLVICSNYKGEKMCFCTPECSAAYFRRINKEKFDKKLVDISSGKGFKTQFVEETV